MSNYVLGVLDRIDMLSGAQVFAIYALLLVAAVLVVWVNKRKVSE